MDSGDAIQIFILLLLLLLSAFFSSAETALTTVNKIRIRTLAEDGNKQAIKINKILEDSGKMLSAILIGNNVVNLSASSIATSLAIKLLKSNGAGIATGIITLLILVFGEITPKTISTLHAEKISLAYSSIIYSLMVIMTPVIKIINSLSLIVLKVLRINPNAKTETYTEDELRTIVEVSHEDGVIENEEKKMINNVFDFGDSQAKDIMIPRIDVTFFNVNSTYSEIIEIYKRDLFTRFPVYENTTDNVIGIINMKDLLLYNESEEFDIRNYLREPYFIYELKKTSELLLEMRQSFVNFAIVLDEYGATAGLVTLEDLLEEIVGEIRDEYDLDEEEAVIKLGNNEYIVEGSMKLDDINELLEINLESDDYDSIGGYIIEKLDHLPEEGQEVVTEDNIKLVAEKVDKKRIEKVHMYLLNQFKISVE